MSAFAVLASASTRAAGNPVVDAWLGGQTNVSTWSADFVQTRRLPALARPLTAPGHVWFATPDRFRWELGEPVQSVAVRRGDALLVLSPRLKRAETLDLRAVARGPMRDAMALLDTGFPRDAAEFSRRFEVRSIGTTNACHELNLLPRDAGARRLLAGLTVTVATNGFALVATELRFADGTVLRNDFTNAAVNAAIAPGRFDTAVPEGYSVAGATRTSAIPRR